jgi:hypothetical protein
MRKWFSLYGPRLFSFGLVLSTAGTLAKIAAGPWQF